MKENTKTAAQKKAVKAIPEGFHTVTPFLMSDDAAKHIDFIKKAFGGQVTYSLKHEKDKIMHATIKIGNSLIMIADTMPDYGAISCMLYLYVDDVDAMYKKAIKAGGKGEREPLTEFYGDRSACIKDDWGNTWWLATHVEDVSDADIKSRMKDWEKKQENKN